MPSVKRFAFESRKTGDYRAITDAEQGISENEKTFFPGGCMAPALGGIGLLDPLNYLGLMRSEQNIKK